MKINAVSNLILLVYIGFLFSCKEKRKVNLNLFSEERMYSIYNLNYSYSGMEQRQLYSVNGLCLGDSKGKISKFLGKPDSLRDFSYNPLTGELRKSCFSFFYKQSKIVMTFGKIRSINIKDSIFKLDKLDIKIGDNYEDVDKKFPDFLWKPFKDIERKQIIIWQNRHCDNFRFNFKEGKLFEFIATDGAECGEANW